MEYLLFNFSKKNFWFLFVFYAKGMEMKFLSSCSFLSILDTAFFRKSQIVDGYLKASNMYALVVTRI